MHRSIISLIIITGFSFFSIAETIADRLRAADIFVHSNGILQFSNNGDSHRYSPNGVYRATYEIGNVSHDTRELHNFNFYRDNTHLFSLKIAPGSELYISNSGYIVFVNMLLQHQNQVMLLFYSPRGDQLFSQIIETSTLLDFSDDGNHFVIGNRQQTRILSLPQGGERTYPPADQFDISADGASVALARRGKVLVFEGEELSAEFTTGFLYPRAVELLPNGERVAVIDKLNLLIYSIPGQRQEAALRPGKACSFRDLSHLDDLFVAGIHLRRKGESQGILRVIDLAGNVLEEQRSPLKKFETFEREEAFQPTSSEYPEIPWPFVPFDSMHTVWNYYEQHMGLGGGSSYMHQGLDMITPINEPTYAVADGITKLNLTIGGDIYWRIATSSVQEPGFSRGWLYAHLVESTIQFDVGDTVEIHDYIGDIIAWTSEWGHIHFVEIEDSGLVWYYDDNEWGITYNPLNSLRSNQDDIAPLIEPVFEDSKFAFCLNETSQYLEPDSLYGEIDIITKVVDYIGDSEWQQPAYECYYWIESLEPAAGNTTIVPRTLGQRLNHFYEEYNSGHYTLYAPLIYKLDDLLTATSWMETERNFYHLLTNSDGDSILDLSEADLAFNTAEHPDGAYRVFIEVRDQFQNATIDSMDVEFKNGITTGTGSDLPTLPRQTALLQNYPNPFNPETVIRYRISTTGYVHLEIFDINGRHVRTLVDGVRSAEQIHTVMWDGRDNSGNPVASGIYFYQLKTEDGQLFSKRMVLLR